MSKTVVLLIDLSPSGQSSNPGGVTVSFFFPEGKKRKEDNT
jgi:hypothetical protein